MTDDKVYYGTVIWFSKSFGFLAREEGGDDIFVHYSDINMDGFKVLAKGQRVSYQLGLNFKGQPKAINVVVVK